MAVSIFAENLRVLCNSKGSVAEVCRRLRINRQQFNRYLAGQSYPRGDNLRRILDFFNVSESQILLAPEAFRESLAPLRRGAPSADDEELRRHLARLQKRQSNQDLRRYHGFYFKYHRSFGYSDYILRSLVYLFPEGEQTHIRTVERLVSIDAPPLPAGSFTGKNRGLVMLIENRIFIVGYESLTTNAVSEIILYPTYKNRITFLSGLAVGVGANNQRQPVAAPVLFEYLGRSIGLRRTLRKCGLYRPDSDQLDDLVKQTLGRAGALLVAPELAS